MAKLSSIFTFVILSYTFVLPSCLTVNDSLTVNGRQTKHTNFPSTTTHFSSTKTSSRINHGLQLTNNTRKHGLEQEGDGKTKGDSTNVLRKRTMDRRLSLKNLVHIRSFPKPRKPFQIRASSPFVRSRLSSLRSSTFKPIHIYGSVPFQTFLSALSKSRGQGSSPPPVNRAYTAPSYPQVSQEGQDGQGEGGVGSSVRGEVGQFGGIADKALVPRQYPVPQAMPMEAQGNFPMFLNAPNPMSQPFPMRGDFPMLPPGNMPYFDQPHNYRVGHHTAHHHSHHKGKSGGYKYIVDMCFYM